MAKAPDSLIFDMDGTLWDAVDTYMTSWNHVLKVEGLDVEIERKQFESIIGLEKHKVLDILLPGFETGYQLEIYDKILELRKDLLPRLGGKLYDGVKEGLELLSQRYPLFIVSNCAENVITQFMTFTNLTRLIKDEMAYGVNQQPKHHNIKLLMDKHRLKRPVYIGDTETDSSESQKANIPFVFMTYGFGNTPQYDYRFDDFNSFTKYFWELGIQ